MISGCIPQPPGAIQAGREPNATAAEACPPVGVFPLEVPLLSSDPPVGAFSNGGVAGGMVPPGTCM